MKSVGNDQMNVRFQRKGSKYVEFISSRIHKRIGKEIGKCSRSIRHIVNKIGKDFNYEIFKHISNELRKQF